MTKQEIKERLEQRPFRPFTAWSVGLTTQARSADLKSAVSPICNRQGVGRFRAPPDWPEPQQVENLRYGRLKICATVHRAICSPSHGLSSKVRVAGDGEYDVPTGDHAHLHPNGRLLFIHLDTGGTAILDVPLIASLQIKETA